jgi:small subunit ribosomal protein S6
MIIHEYETTLIFHPEAPESEVQRITERLDGVIESFEGHKLFHDHWGARKLAYPIQKQARGNYFHMGFVATAECIAELERILRIESHMMRFLTVRLLEDVALEERQLAASNRTAVMSADSADEEDERYDRDRDRDRDRRPPRREAPPAEPKAEAPAPAPAPAAPPAE